MNSRVHATLLGGAILAAVSSAAALAAPVPATIRVEGANATLIAERAQASSETNVYDRSSGTVQTVSGPSALGQLIRASVATRTVARTSFSDAFGPLAAVVEAIGPDDQGVNFDGPGFWLFKVNHKASEVGANQKLLTKGDEVLWYFTANFEAKELDITVPGRPIRTGRRFTTQVTAYDEKGKGTPAAGARVTYAGTTRTANKKGRATFTVRRGERPVRATRADDIRSPGEPVCGFARTVSECQEFPPDGNTLRVIFDGKRNAGWRRSSAALRQLAAGASATGAVIAWRGSVYRTAPDIRRIARNLVQLV